MENYENKDNVDVEALLKLVSNAYHTCVVVNEYCKNNTETEEVKNIAPVIKIILSNLDKAYSILLK